MIKLDAYFEIQDRLMDSISKKFKRYLYSKIDWKARMIGLTGYRGVGKTTLLLQKLADMDVSNSESLYISADNPLVLNDGIYNIGDTFFKHGGKLLVVDESHRYPGWSLELKALYDSFPNKKIIFTGSSSMEIMKGKADLSRRTLIYKLNILSFREYVQIRTGDTISPVKLEEILRNHNKIAKSLLHYEPLRFFSEYLREGAYPYFIEGNYYNRLLNTLDKIIYDDILGISDIKPEGAATIKRLIAFLATSKVPRISPEKLCRSLNITKPTLYNYLDLMEKVLLINRVPPEKIGHKYLRSGAKVFLNNPNIYYALNQPAWSLEKHLGTIRESFFVNQLVQQTITAPDAGDFTIRKNGQFIVFEIGGKKKDTKQIKDMENGYVLNDDIETGRGQNIPLYLMGLLY
ncbi:MAG: AAA family ATPase [Thermotogota bacterium]|nr:AAA family ATPase [Thermotogota bacterium]